MGRKYIFKNIVTATIFIFISLSLFKVYGLYLDKNQDTAFLKTHNFNPSGYIDICEEYQLKKGKDKALIFIHGLQNCPDLFQTDLAINTFESQNEYDVFIPALPYHGRHVQELSLFSFEETEDYLIEYIRDLKSDYKEVKIIGMSMGGSILYHLASKNPIIQSQNIYLIAPAIYLKDNHLFNRLFASIYSVWRDYCDYELLQCNMDEAVFNINYNNKELSREFNIPFLNVHLLKKLFNYELEVRDLLKKDKYNKKFKIYLSEDDNLVDYKLIKKACEESSFCYLNSFTQGRHMLVWTKEFQEIILDIIND